MKRSRGLNTGMLIAAAVFAVGMVLYAKRSSAASSSTPASTGPSSSAPVLPPTMPALAPDFGIENPTGGWS
ncbi:MAG: hypothetical protein ACRDLF_14935 [Solirubrobacteraceae bacterium]